MWDPYAEFESATLPNGLTVHAAHWSGRPWQAMGFLVHSGAEQDPVGLEGLAHFTEHLVAAGSSKVPADAVSSFFEDHGGGAMLGGTNHEMTKYTFFAPAEKVVLARAFDLFGNMLLHATFDEFVERERSVILSEYHQRPQPQFKIDIEARRRKALFAGYWLERFESVLGTPRSVNRITQKDLQGFYDQHYTPENISVVTVGGMRLSELTNLISWSPLADEKRGVRTPLPTPASSIDPPSETRHVFELSKHMNVSLESGGYESTTLIPGSESPYTIDIVERMLRTVLTEEVREKRAWTYHIGCSTYYHRHFSEFGIICDSFKLNALDEIEEVIEQCVASITHHEDLFKKIKHRLIMGVAMTDPNGCDVRNHALNQLADHQRIITLTEQEQGFKKVCFNDVQRVMQWFSQKHRYTLIRKP